MKVNTERLEEQASELRVIAYRMREIQDSVLRTSRVLSRESVGERFRIPIRNAASSVEKRYEELMRMQSALRDIANIYERSEREILDEAEHANVHHDFNVIRAVALPVLNLISPIYDTHRWHREQSERFRAADRVLDQLRERVDQVFDTGERNHAENPLRDAQEVLRDAAEAGADVIYDTHAWHREQAQRRSDLDRLWEAVRPQFSRGLNPIPEVQIPDPIDVSEFFPTAENGGIHAAPGMDRVIESITQPVGPSAGSPLDYISGPAEMISGADTNLGSSGAIDWTPWNP